MTARPIGSATVSFGLVSVPVKLYSAAESTAKITFNWIHKDCGSRLKQQYVCKNDGEILDREDMVKGYEFAKGQYVLFTPEELKALEEKATESIEIAEFVPAQQVERLYLDKIYYLGPDKGGERAYRLLSKAMQETGLSALARYAARGKQYLVLVRPMDDGLVMEQLHYAHEIRPFSEVPMGDGDIKKEELKLAIQLVQQAASDQFQPERYQDDVRNRMLELIQRKVEGEDITQAPAEEPKAQIIDLMEALKASLAKGGTQDVERKPAKRAGREPTKKAAAKRKRARG
ncbi:MAG: Ku protein [Gemmatimonadales bacterium]|nr:Ku protein [Gemmatimonadales bacterium]NIN12525.1 Ku protein [Gemmatimonadales bacterium]NIN50896.1 Ku protein [Gemmatimonadales bacterium]NIP08360.1 Ku protein [Gemmatimonadales bacterium]NIR03457.1 Ku protein [Gemmatimonadales bacterium]